MKIKFSGFDWDSANKQKCEKHGVSTDEIESLFRARNLLLAPDIDHSSSEDRFIAIGKSAVTERYIFAVFTLRHSLPETLLRPISARFMHKKEIARYEETLAEIEKR